MKKVKIECCFNLDVSDNTRTLSKLKFSLSVVDSETGETLLIPKSNNADIGAIIKQVLSRWDNVNNKLTLTTAQWNSIKNKIDKN